MQKIKKALYATCDCYAGAWPLSSKWFSIMNVHAFYEKVTQEVIHMLKQGKVPWQQTWLNSHPQNAATGYAYQGFNAFWASFDTQQHKFEIARYATFKQIIDAGGILKKGAHGIPIVYFASTNTNKKQSEKEEEKATICYKPVTHYVFNTCQVTGANFETVFENQTSLNAETIISNYPNGPKVKITTGYQPSYSPGNDTVYMPPLNHFWTSEDYYLAYFHELAHSTGHSSRLNRHFGKKSETEKYAYEELIAEITAYMLMAKANIHTSNVETNTKAYLQGWISRLENDKQLLFKACNMAQKACDWVLWGQFVI